MTNLHIHDRHVRQAALGGQVVDALVGVFTEGGHSTPARWRDAQDVLRTVRGSEHWIECGCAIVDGTGALMSPRLLQTGQLTLVRHGRVLHAEACPFHRMRQVGDIEPAGESSPLSDALQTLLMLEDGTAITDQLAHCATELLMACGYDTIDGASVRSTPGEAAVVGHVDIASHYGQTDRVSDLPMGEGRALHDVWCTHLATVPRMFERWANAGVRRALFFGVVNQVEDGVLVRAPRNAPEARVRPRHILERSPGVPGPFWVLACVDVEGKCLERAYVWPVAAAAALMPVESERDRDVAKVLWGQVSYWAKSKSRAFTLRKPIRSQALVSEADFVLEGPDRTIDVYVVPAPGQYRAVAETQARIDRHALSADARRHLPALVNDEPVDAWRKSLTSAALRGT